MLLCNHSWFQELNLPYI
uniref:Uncharacterized protein n=1 Tax=Arundo donax TaxID=35708 RepID=A0A0A9B0L9_ARUDO